MTARSHHAPSSLARHLIAAIHYAPERSGDVDSVECSCGWDTTAETHLELDDRWREHRRTVGAPAKVFSDTIRDTDVSDPYRRSRRPRIGPSVPPEYWPTW